MKKNYFIISIFFLFSCGGGGGSETIEISQNNPPSITNNVFTYNVIENQSDAFSIQASDPEGDSISFQIFGGLDKDIFS